MHSLPADHLGWLAAAHDPVVGPALALLHHDPRHACSIAELASRAGASRSVIGERCLHLLGTPLSEA